MSTIKVGTLLAANGSTTTQPSIPALETRMAKAWVNIDGTGTIAIRGSYNVSSVADNGTGRYTANFATALPNTNYIGISGGGVYADNAGNGQGRNHMINKMTTTHCAISNFNQAGSAYEDTEVSSILVFGN